MRYAVFGDIHGNLEAFEAVLTKLEQEKPDRYICMGDIVGYGADPVACMEKVKGLKDCVVVVGNHDFATAGILNTDFFNPYAMESVLWTRQQLKPDEIEFLRRLKLLQRVNNITVVHSNLYAPEMFEYIQTSYDALLGLNKLETPLCFVGHSHVPGVFSSQDDVISYVTEHYVPVTPGTKLIVNVGSVGQPRDDNPEAAYAIYDEAENVVWIKRVEYDVPKAADKIIQAGLPNILAERLKYGR